MAAKKDSNKAERDKEANKAGKAAARKDAKEDSVYTNEAGVDKRPGGKEGDEGIIAGNALLPQVATKPIKPVNLIKEEIQVAVEPKAVTLIVECEDVFEPATAKYLELHYVGQTITKRIREFDPGKVFSIAKAEYIIQRFKEGFRVMSRDK